MGICISRRHAFVAACVRDAYAKYTCWPSKHWLRDRVIVDHVIVLTKIFACKCSAVLYRITADHCANSSYNFRHNSRWGYIVTHKNNAQQITLSHKKSWTSLWCRTFGHHCICMTCYMSCTVVVMMCKLAISRSFIQNSPLLKGTHHHQRWPMALVVFYYSTLPPGARRKTLHFGVHHFKRWPLCLSLVKLSLLCLCKHQKGREIMRQKWRT